VTRVLFCGLATLDFVLGVDAIPTTAEKHRAREAEIVGGGGAANAAVAAARLGAEAALACRLGADAVGDMIAEGLAREGVSLDLSPRSPGGRSAFSAVCVDRAGERMIVNFRGEGLSDDPGVLEAAGPFDAALADTRWPEGAEALMRLAAARGVPGVIDAETPVCEPALRAASHVAFSAQGLRGWIGAEDDAALREAARRCGGWICVTDGPEGVRVAEDDGVRRVPGFRVAAVDTLGAGDVWHGAFALALAEGVAETPAARFANAAAALKCARRGGRAGAPRRAEVEAFLKEHTP
jgi:sulfofructose kinase